MDGAQHPSEEEFLAFAKKTLTEEYMKLLAAFIKNRYPGSAERVMPKLRIIYKEKFKNGKSKRS